MRLRPTLSCIVILIALPVSNFSTPWFLMTNQPPQEQSQFERLLAEEWEYELRESPETATSIGDYRYNDRWSDPSLEHVEQQKKDLAEWLARFEQLKTAGFSEQEKLSSALMIRSLKERLEGIRLKTYEMPIDQFNGLHLEMAQLLAIVPFDSTKHYDDYLARLHRLPTVFNQVIEVLKQGEKDGLMPPRYLLEKTVTQCRDLAGPEAEANPFGQPVTHFPETVGEVDRSRLRQAILEAVEHEIRPAYRKLGSFLEDEYAPRGRTQPGVWALPGGEALYRYDIRVLTTTTMEPEEIHRLGLEEVARIEAEQRAIAKRLGFDNLQGFRASLKTNPHLFATSPEQLVDRYRSYVNQMKPELAKLFTLFPKAPLEVRPTQEFRAKEAAAADYSSGTPDGSRPGIVYVNTYDYAHRSLLTAESTSYHEGIPGHHMQISIAQTLPELPAFRRYSQLSAYVEGWALYAERLGKDIGFYQDPYSDYGRLSDEMLRAIRLVVDTGVHYEHWTRQQMVDFFHQHSSEDESDLQAETDRYIVWPAQALGYKLGQLEILKLRDRAQQELGTKYDIRTFHDEVLNGGALPLDVLDERVGGWIERQKRTPGQ